jgi:hypothetical protein
VFENGNIPSEMLPGDSNCRFRSWEITRVACNAEARLFRDKGCVTCL